MRPEVFSFSNRLVAHGVVTAQKQSGRIPGILMHPLPVSVGPASWVRAGIYDEGVHQDRADQSGFR